MDSQKFGQTRNGLFCGAQNDPLPRTSSERADPSLQRIDLDRLPKVWPNSRQFFKEKTMKSIPRQALCAGTFDPPTLGHLNIIERGFNVFDKLVVAVAPSLNKNP